MCDKKLTSDCFNEDILFRLNVILVFTNQNAVVNASKRP